MSEMADKTTGAATQPVAPEPKPAPTTAAAAPVQEKPAAPAGATEPKPAKSAPGAIYEAQVNVTLTANGERTIVLAGGLVENVHPDDVRSLGSLLRRV